MGTNLSDYFTGIAAKRLARVEIHSNQHEFNGTAKLKSFLGIERKKFPVTYMFLPDEQEQILQTKGTLTWYDVRESNPDRSAEFRLYYDDKDIIPNAETGDLVVFCRNKNGEIVIIVSPQGSTTEQQILWLFNLDEVENIFRLKEYEDEKRDIGPAGKYILNQLGIVQGEEDDNYLEQMLRKFGTEFPSTREFSKFARSTVKEISVREAPDEALIVWWEREGVLLRTFESAIIKRKLELGFGDDQVRVEGFIQYALSVLNRRKSRAGHSFENHLEAIFSDHQLEFSRNPKTERTSRPDFIFPGERAYHNHSFDRLMLTMLAAKTTLKDRWRQILPEADRIPVKHLVTLEPAISQNQTTEIIANDIQLVIPSPLMHTFSDNQKQYLMPLSSFIELVKARQVNN